MIYRNIKNFEKSFYKKISDSPARISVIAFALLIALGTVFLMLPYSSNGSSINFIDALFTSISASCVTGLAVFDTGSGLTIFGQTILLILIQFGGLGIMTMSTLLLLVAKKRPSLAGQNLIKDTFTTSGRYDLYAILRNVIIYALSIEAIGALILFFRFLPEFGFNRAAYISIFHSISAFCNAGFSIFPDSFMSYREDWVINIVISLLIIFGGLGFLVIFEIKQKLFISDSKRRWSRLSLHSKLAISSTLILLVTGTLIIAFMEWNNTLKGLSASGHWLGAFFQSVTLRTAGFNTIEIGKMTNEALFFSIILMFIGACPGSCAGGIKTTTFSTLSILGIAHLRGRDPHIFNRKISKSSINKAVSLFMLSMFIIILGTMFLLITEVGQVPHGKSSGRFLEILFEVVSAFGTVGLSTGITATLTSWGKLTISVIMFIGRLGPLAIAVAISRSKVSLFSYAEENIMIG